MSKKKKALEKENIVIIKLLLGRGDLDISNSFKSKYFNYNEKLSIYPAIEKGNNEIIQLMLDEPQYIGNSLYIVHSCKGRYLSEIGDIFESKFHRINQINITKFHIYYEFHI